MGAKGGDSNLVAMTSERLSGWAGGLEQLKPQPPTYFPKQ